MEVQVYQAVLELIASEFSARMVAMRNATDNAGELLDDLQLGYNKARQATITREIIEVSAGRQRASPSEQSRRSAPDSDVGRGFGLPATRYRRGADCYGSRDGRSGRTGAGRGGGLRVPPGPDAGHLQRRGDPARQGRAEQRRTGAALGSARGPSPDGAPDGAGRRRRRHRHRGRAAS